MSLFHGGACIPFVSPSVLHYLCGKNMSDVPLEITDYISVWNKVNEVKFVYYYCTIVIILNFS